MAGPAPLIDAEVGLNAGIAEATAGSHQPCQTAVFAVRALRGGASATGGRAVARSAEAVRSAVPMRSAARHLGEASTVGRPADAAAVGYSGAKSDGGRETSAVVPEPGVTLSPTLMPCRVASRATTWNPSRCDIPTSMSGGEASG